MAWYVRYMIFLECDAPGCKRHLTVETGSKLDTIAQARQDFWQLSEKTGKCLCPAHRKEQPV